MRLLVLNPNATTEMTDRIGAEVTRHLPKGIDLILRTNLDGPASIQGHADGLAAQPGTLALLAQTPFDVAVIGCFDDTGLSQTPVKSVIGLGESAMRQADQTGQPYAVLTTSELSVPILTANAQAYGADVNLVCIRASKIEVLDFETHRALASARLITAAQVLLSDHPEIETIVLGCAGMGGLAAELQNAVDIAIIDPIPAAIDAALALMKAPARS
ncbi:aspartate/glutamate racemase family protein [Roseobacter sp. N2S]|uniref:aspartate/glutamate racemase family protein n=1 Tax=Roseobacter sp. N2S TaxID=2663844 RepID=UPI00285B706A|nr:aspartate/glutamate racemase family protein [Roseobacter sp. N2S]MDR6266616.1 allantoin racemase [Roseobacter sp. N2S]